MKKLRLAQAMMMAAIFLIVGFQAYYIYRLYKSEWNDLKKETDVLFRETVYKLQVARFKKDTTFLRKLGTDNVLNFQAVNVVREAKTRLRERTQKGTSTPGKTFFIATSSDSLKHREFPEDLTTRMDSLALENEGQVRIVTSQQGGKRIQIISQNRFSRDTLPTKVRNIDPLVKKQTIKGTKGDKNFVRPSLMSNQRKAGRHAEMRRKASALESNPTVSVTSSFDDPEIDILYHAKSLNDSLPLPELDSAYKSDLRKSAINILFTISKTTGTKNQLGAKQNAFSTEVASVGLLSAFHYQATFESPFYFLVRKIAPNIIFSILLVGFTIGSFIVLYRNLTTQKRLADIKNEFISNITHELKTPIATVSVAIEAMKSFNALDDPERTKEYLDISQSELQRLSLLVDKVLRLSMFGKNEIEWKKDSFNLEELTKEVMTSMNLQFQKCKSNVLLNVSGNNFDVEADRLHITSVIYNLLDNALKYSGQNAEIRINIISHAGLIELSVTDNGIGIANEYKSKVFEQFFRVPDDNRHNIKGYGLGLSYVSHVIKNHNGSVKVESELGKGSTFIVKLPYAGASLNKLDNIVAL